MVPNKPYFGERELKVRDSVLGQMQDGRTGGMSDGVLRECFVAGDTVQELLIQKPSSRRSEDGDIKGRYQNTETLISDNARGSSDDVSRLSDISLRNDDVAVGHGERVM